jgi:hypothetical protein
MNYARYCQYLYKNTSVKDLIKKRLNHLLNEAKKSEYQYQVRDIGGSDVYYKRKKGEKLWTFTDEKDFTKNSNKENIVKYKPKNK